MQTWLIKSLAVSDGTQLLAPRSSPESGDGVESFNPFITELVFPIISPHLEAVQGPSKSHLISINSGVVKRGTL